MAKRRNGGLDFYHVHGVNTRYMVCVLVAIAKQLKILQLHAQMHNAFIINCLSLISKLGSKKITIP